MLLVVPRRKSNLRWDHDTQVGCKWFALKKIYAVIDSRLLPSVSKQYLYRSAFSREPTVPVMNGAEAIHACRVVRE